MLKHRIMPILLFKEVGLVKGVGFDSWRRVGTAMQAVKVYNMRQVDELVFLDIAATPSGSAPDFHQIDELADVCFMPMTVGGGVRSLDHVRELLAVGADKVALNTGAIENPDLIAKAADRFGSQCVTLSIDVRRDADGSVEVMSHCGREATGLDPIAWAREVEARGAGEILLGSVDRDGTMTGYDVEMVRAVSDAVGVPVIASGGAGSYEHMADVIETGGADAVAAASIFHFTEMTPKGAKRFLGERGLPVRHA
jgi:imidazole glycerol-phosphate synthase subunit HisF